MRVRLLVDAEIKDLTDLRKWVGDGYAVQLIVHEDDSTKKLWGHIVGAKESHE